MVAAASLILWPCIDALTGVALDLWRCWWLDLDGDGALDVFDWLADPLRFIVA